MSKTSYLCAGLLLAAGLPTACGGSDEPPTARTTTQRAAPARSAPAPEPTPCPPGLANCHSASGRIIYVEAVDPDGDGDAHFVLASSDSITGPGISVIDCRKDLRPHPLPRIGDRLSAAGPVYPGSFGQKQIQAVAIHFARVDGGR